jgi:transcriptional regulator with XRE-family HTH domain
MRSLKMTKDVSAQFASDLKEQMKSRRMTQKDVAAALKVSESNVSQYLSGRKNLTIETMTKLAHVVGCCLDIAVLSGKKDTFISVDRKSVPWTARRELLLAC